MRLLLVEDEMTTAAMLAKGLRENAHSVDLANTAARALELAFVNEYEAVILDVMLLDRDGFGICRELRASGCNAWILMLTARDALDDRVTGLDAGADDHLVKPFAFPELLARLRALSRRGATLRAEILEIADLQVDTRAQRVQRAGKTVELTAKEYALLEFLARNENQVVARSAIGEHVWDDGFDPFSNLIEVYIQRLRRKVDEGNAPKLIHTRRGAGYMLTAIGGDDDGAI
jgi:two-component system, OmpR family, copper resistance phosphate regulon response regulator CusR